MSAKGYPHIRPVSVAPVQNDTCWYYYYDLPEGLLEVEVVQDEKAQVNSHRVTAFVTDKARVRDLLGSLIQPAAR